MNFSKAVSDQLYIRKMTISELANGMGYSVAHISDLLAGNRRWNETTIDKACEILGIEIKFVSKSA